MTISKTTLWSLTTRWEGRKINARARYLTLRLSSRTNQVTTYQATTVTKELEIRT